MVTATNCPLAGIEPRTFWTWYRLTRTAIVHFKSYQTFFRCRWNDPTSPGVFFREFFVDSEKIGEPSHDAELRLLEGFHVGARVNPIRQKAGEKTVAWIKPRRIFLHCRAIKLCIRSTKNLLRFVVQFFIITSICFVCYKECLYWDQILCTQTKYFVMTPKSS